MSLCPVASSSSRADLHAHTHRVCLDATDTGEGVLGRHQPELLVIGEIAEFFANAFEILVHELYLHCMAGRLGFNVGERC